LTGTDCAVFAHPDASAEQLASIEAAVRSETDPAAVRALSKVAALDEFRRLYADSPEITKSLTAENFPVSVRVSMRDRSRAARFETNLRGVPAVATVECRSAAADHGAEPSAATTTPVQDSTEPTATAARP
jgi:cell division protein FtsX